MASLGFDNLELQTLLERIRDDARLEADRLRAEAEARAETLLAEARSEAEAEAGRITAAASERSRQRALADRAEARRRARFRVLMAKHQMLDEIFQKAQERIRGNSQESFRRLTEVMLLRFAEPGSLTLIVDTAERPWVDEPFLAELEGRLNRFRPGVRLEAVEERKGQGGGIVLKEGRREIDLRIPVIVGQLRESLEAVLAEELFPREEDLFSFSNKGHAAPD